MLNRPSIISARLSLRAAPLLFLSGVLVLAGCGSSVEIAVPVGPTNPTGQLTVSSSSLTFSVVGLGAKSVMQTLSVTNTGTTTVSFTSLTLTGDFTQTNNTCVSTLAAGATCSVGIVFVPAATGARTGTAVIKSSAAAQTISLSGTGGTSVSNLSGSSLSFGPVTIGTTSSVQSITLTSPGTAPLAISGFSVTGDFLPVSDTCGSLVAINTTCTISINFTPSALGSRTGSVLITSNGSASPQTISLSGTGIAPVTYAGSPLAVKVEAKTQPISGASVQLYAAGSTGSGSGSTAMLASALTTNSSGIAMIPAGYTCPFAGALLYVVSSGGTVGSAGTANPNARLMTALGPCNAIVAGTQFVVTEATTVASAYALAQFYTAGSIGATVTNLSGLTNAFATAATLADPITNATPGSSMPANASSPAPRINAVANIVNACLVSSSACASFFTATTITTTPTNTLDALFNLVRKPTSNVSALYTQSLLSTAYTPVLTAQPTDWTMFVTYSGGGMSSTSGLGVDTKGNVWVSNYFNVASKFSPIGAPAFPNGITGYGLNNSYGLALDLADDAWIPNEQPYQFAGNIGSVTELSSSGAAISGASGYVGGGLNYPTSVAIDPDGTVWVVDYGDSYLSILNTIGTPLYGTIGFTAPLFAFPVVVAVDGNHFAWVGNQSSNQITKVSPDGSSFTNYATGEGPSGIAIDQNNNIWMSNYYDNNIALLTNSAVLIGTYTAGGSILRPQGIAIDGAGNVWVTNYRAPFLNELAGATAPTPGASLTPAAGIGADAGLLEAYALAIDASGNLWITNQGSSTLTKFIGLATPVKTPLSGIPKLP